MKSYYTNLFMDGMMKFSQIDGNMNAGCPKLQAPPMLTSFEEVDLSIKYLIISLKRPAMSYQKIILTLYKINNYPIVLIS